MAITLEWILKQRAAVDAEIASYQSARKDENGNRISRNKHTAQRGITYIAATNRFRTFAHYPFYQYVGTFADLGVAVQARDAYEAQARKRLEQAVPELADEAKNQSGIGVAMRRRINSKVVDVAFYSPHYVAMARFIDYEDILRWLARQRLIYKSA